MAVGDKAVAAGMAKCLGTALANTLDDEVNLTRDYIADRARSVVSATAPASPAVGDLWFQPI